MNIVKQDLLNKKQFENFMKSERVGFQWMQILGLLGMYFDAVVVEVEKYLLFFRLALASGHTVYIQVILKILMTFTSCRFFC